MAQRMRISIYKHLPDVARLMHNLADAASKGIDIKLKNLMWPRASQINRCAFGIDMHAKDARAAGESEERLALLAASDEAENLVTGRERAAAHFEEPDLARLLALVTAANGYNRLNVTARVEGAHYTPGQFERQS